MTIAVVPRLSKNRKRDLSGKFTRAAPALVDSKFLEGVLCHGGRRRFHWNGLELLSSPTVHTLKQEASPLERELRLFEDSTLWRSDLERGMEWDIDPLVHHAVRSALCELSRHFWREGDRMRIRDGVFQGFACHIHKIDWEGRSAIVDIMEPGWLGETHVEVRVEEMERQFLLGDNVCVILDTEKGKYGSITTIRDNVASIVVNASSASRETVAYVILFPPSTFLSLINYPRSNAR